MNPERAIVPYVDAYKQWKKKRMVGLLCLSDAADWVRPCWFGAFRCKYKGCGLEVTTDARGFPVSFCAAHVRCSVCGINSEWDQGHCYECCEDDTPLAKSGMTKQPMSPTISLTATSRMSR